jgi:rubrerythrin
MKNLTKILIAALFFSSAVALCAYAEEGKPAEVVDAMASAVPPAPAEKTTLDNLQAAFNGENNAHVRYLAFAKKADQEGYGKAASLFRAASRAEQVHFERHAEVIKELGGVPTAKIETPVVKSTPENLKAAMEGEIYESAVMYPEFLAKAEKENSKNAVDAFEDAERAETVHAGLYKKALGDLKAWKGKNKNFSVCMFCGNVVEKLDFKECPICGKSKKQFVKVK